MNVDINAVEASVIQEKDNEIDRLRARLDEALRWMKRISDRSWDLTESGKRELEGAWLRLLGE